VLRIVRRADHRRERAFERAEDLAHPNLNRLARQLIAADEPDWSLDAIVTDQTTAADSLVIRDLRVAPIASPETAILQGIDLEVGKGQVHAIMGPNGSGKTTLAYALMGHPSYVITGGDVTWKGRDLLKLSPDKRARLGMFLAFQYPTAIPGLSVASFIRSAVNAKLQGIDKTSDVDPTDAMKGGISMRDFRTKMREKMSLLKMDEGFASRYVNEGFSGG
jgi:Fe-S cluster assembly ATP-binding protein